MNTFYGYPGAVHAAGWPVRPAHHRPGLFLVPEVNRFVHVVLTLDQDPATGDFLGSNHLDVAISDTGDPTGTWTVYSIPAQNDGTQGTPDHGCPVPDPDDVPEVATNPRPRWRLPAPGNGRERHLSGDERVPPLLDGFNGAQIYAIGLDQLRGASLPMAINLMHVENTRIAGTPGFTVWPATSSRARARRRQAGRSTS